MNYKLHHGNCLDVMKGMGDNSVDLILTDPPYPDMKGGTEHMIGGVGSQKDAHFSIGDIWDANLDWVDEASRVTKLGIVCFCSYHSVAMFFDKFRANGLIVRALGTWYKRNTPNPVNNVPRFTTEFYWMFQKSPGLRWRSIETMIDVPKPAAGCFAVERVLLPGTKVAAHPTQKPVKLFSEILKIGGATVFDPFMGTGTTGVACADNNQEFIGCELYPLPTKPVDSISNPDYFSIAESRIDKAYRKATGQSIRGNDSDIDSLPMFALQEG